MIKSIMLLIAASVVTGCATNQSSESNYYTESEANTQLDSKLVMVLLVMPAKLEVDNTENANNAI